MSGRAGDSIPGSSSQWLPLIGLRNSCRLAFHSEPDLPSRHQPKGIVHVPLLPGTLQEFCLSRSFWEDRPAATLSAARLEDEIFEGMRSQLVQDRERQIQAGAQAELCTCSRFHRQALESKTPSTRRA